MMFQCLYSIFTMCFVLLLYGMEKIGLLFFWLFSDL